ncbi:MAG: flagellar hook-associated protein FlgK [Proteobacteria bacterium]|nr:flagellar hook-associated protein FlgK [Pseudomonadota bacterium]MBU1687470.1 flagellar hook-associated protein FlgK [Pseudomonadota bacterium]
MGGLSSVLNIAKEALLTHQVSVQVASHNVANVDTPGYSRQTLEVGANLAVPSAIGSIGSGVRADSILRHYDQFMTQRIFNQNSIMGNLQGQEDSMRIVETVFNETSGTGLNNLLSMYWDSWQELSNNPEIQASRQSLIQTGQAMVDQLHFMGTELTKIKYDIGVNLGAAIDDVNGITGQIADLNNQIASSEVGNHQANDLRDRRDQLVGELASLLDITYLENSSGSYSVMLPDGHPLVDKGASWDLDWQNNQLKWKSVNSEGIEITATIGVGDEVGGKIGGWLEVRSQLIENDPNNYLGRLDAFANALIREVNQQVSEGVGLQAYDESILGTSELANEAVLTTMLDSASAVARIDAGVIRINDREVGKVDGAVAVDGLAMGKAANAVQAINDATTGVAARLTTQVSGAAVTPIPANDGEVISFDLNGITISYTVDNDGAVPLPDDNDQATFAANMVAAINATLTAYNVDPTNPVDITIEAVVGDGTNGGAVNSIILRNTNAGDDSEIRITNLSSNPASGIEANLGLTAGTYRADATHNTGEITLFSRGPFTLVAGTDDRVLNELGMGGGMYPTDNPGDGRFTFSSTNGTVQYSLHGYDYFDELVTDGGTFELWIYNTNGTLALPQPLAIPLDRVYTLQDVVDAINVTITNASGGAPWITAVVNGNQLELTPDANHSYAFGKDSSNLLQVAGVNTYFTGHGASDIGVNPDMAKNLDFIGAGTVNPFGEIFKGDNSNALMVTLIQRTEDIAFTGANPGTLDGFYNTLVSEIGMKGKRAAQDYEFNELVSNQLNQMRDSVAGVSLDEEMANLVKFQHAYTAAARLIGIADEMMADLVASLNR